MTGQAYYPIITAQQVKDTLPEVNDNIPDELIVQHIKIAQQMKIRPILGYDYLYELQTQVSGNSVTTANQFILDNYLYMILALHVQLRLTINNTYQLENAGLRLKLSDVSNVAETADINLYRTWVQNDIDFLVNEMIKFIDENQSDYPTFITRTDPRENTLNETRRNYNWGFGIGKVEGDCVKYGIGHPIN